MKKLLIVIAAPTLLLTMALLLAAALITGGGEVVPWHQALREVPQDIIPLYEAAASTCDGMDWTLLAAVHRTETSFGRGGAVSWAGAQGPMQFMPATWATYGVDGDGDGTNEINDLTDAVFGAANYLCANGAGDPARLRSAVFNYNHDLDYVNEVLSVAAGYSAPVAPSGSALAQTSGQEVGNNPRILLPEAGRADIEQGLIDARVLTVLDAMSLRFTVAVSVLKTGHSPYVAGTSSFSNHYFGRAVDIYAVNGEAVTSSSPAARDLTVWLTQLPPGLRPTEIGSPFSDILLPAAFTDAAHQDHIHIGFD